jgi:alpha-1,6-mannosyltransferase
MIKAGALALPRTDAKRSLAAVMGLPAALAAIGLAIVWLFDWGAYLHRFTQGISAYIFLFGVQFALYLLACYAVLRRRDPLPRAASLATIAIVIVFAGVFRGQVAGKPPYLSTDVYRYVWDGRVQANGINPFRYIPTAPELARLRDDKIFPKINGADYAPTPYPPVAQAIYLAVYLIHPLSVTAFKVAMLLFDLLTVVATMLVLVRLRMDPARAIIFAWHPLVIWEGIHSGHVDPAFIGFLALAMLAWVYKKNTLTGVAVGLATLVKLYPVMLLPVFLVNRSEGDGEHGSLGSTQTDSLRYPAPQIGGKRAGGSEAEATQAGSLRYRFRSVMLSKSALHMMLGFVATIVICYLPYLTAGSAVYRNLSDYFKEEGFVQQGGRYFLLTLVRSILPMPTTLYSALGALALGALAVWWLLRRKRDAMDIAKGALALIGLYLLLTSPRYPWYFCWIVPWLCFLPRVGWLYLTGATILLYTLWFIPNEFPNLPLWLGAALYIPTGLLLAAAHFRARSRPGLPFSPIASERF